LTLERMVALALLVATASGCSWLIGVSEDPVVVEAPPAADAGDADAGTD
jgi:hypothetical protein